MKDWLTPQTTGSMKRGNHLSLLARTGVSRSGVAPSTSAIEQWLYWSLRIAIALMFFGHGAFGIITRADWLPYFAVVGIPEWAGWQLEPFIGTMDITLGFITLLSPRRGVLAWTIFWGFLTALMRPLANQGIWEFVTRAGNVGVPLALLYIVGWRTSFSGLWCELAVPRPIGQLNTVRLGWLLRITTAMLLFGHGGLGMLGHKASWITYFGALGISPETVQSASLMSLVGGFEMLLAVAVLLKPARRLLLAVVSWKVGTELLRLPAGEPFWEVPEQSVTVAAPLGLFLVTQWIMEKRRAVVDPERSNRVEKPAHLSAAA